MIRRHLHYERHEISPGFHTCFITYDDINIRPPYLVCIKRYFNTNGAVIFGNKDAQAVVPEPWMIDARISDRDGIFSAELSGGPAKYAHIITRDDDPLSLVIALGDVEIRKAMP